MGTITDYFTTILAVIQNHFISVHTNDDSRYIGICYGCDFTTNTYTQTSNLPPRELTTQLHTHLIHEILTTTNTATTNKLTTALAEAYARHTTGLYTYHSHYFGHDFDPEAELICNECKHTTTGTREDLRMLTDHHRAAVINQLICQH